MSKVSVSPHIMWVRSRITNAAMIAQDPATEAKMAIDDFVTYFKHNRSAAGINSMVTIPNVLLTKNTSAADLQKYTYPS